MRHLFPLKVWILVVCLALSSASAFAQEPEENAPETERPAGEAVEMEEVTVTAARAERPVSSIPGSVTVITREEIEEQTAISSDLGDLLGKTIPGMGLSTESDSDFGQSLRGRDVLYLIDGVPMNTDLRNEGANLQRIDPSAIERIEVIRGASAVYGSGGAGGIVNIITRQAKEGPAQFRTELTTRFSAVHPGDSFSKRIEQSVTGGAGRFNYYLGGFFEDADSRFDAEGDQLPFEGLFSDSDTADVAGKLGYKLTEAQRLRFSANYYRAKQKRGFAEDANKNVVEVPPGVFDAEDAGAPAKPLLRRQQVYTLDYFHDRLLGSTVNLQLFFGDYFKQNPFLGFFEDQFLIDLERRGGRLTIDTPVTVPLKATLTWGLDFTNTRHHEPGIRVKEGLRLEQDNPGGFAQVELPLAERWLVRGGVRHETFRLEVADLPPHPALVACCELGFVQGGTLRYRATTYNLGGVFFVTDAVELFGGFSQGFSITEIGRTIRFTAPPSVEAAKPEPAKVNNYEVGIRRHGPKAEASLSAFYSTSKLGTTTVDDPSGLLVVERAPERVYGVEATIDTKPFTQWGFGGSLSLQEGKREIEGDWKPLPGNRIAPLKLIAYAVYAPWKGWTNRLQAIYSGKRNKFGESSESFEGKVDDFIVVDLVSEVAVWKGLFKVGVENLLNRHYVPPFSQASNYRDFAAGQWMTVGISYVLNW